MSDFDAAAMKGDIDSTLTQLGQKVDSLRQQLSDCTAQVAQLVEENQAKEDALAEKEDELSRLKVQVVHYDEEQRRLEEEINKLREENRGVRRKNENQQVDINNLRAEREVLQDTLLGIQTELEILTILVESAEAEEKGELVLVPDIADSDRGRYRGVFICCGNQHLLNQNEDNFLRLIDAVPQVDWGEDPLYVLKDQQRPGIPEGRHLVAVFFRGLSHPDVIAIKKAVKLTGAKIILHSNLAQMVALIQQWLSHPDFDQVGESYPTGDLANST